MRLWMNARRITPLSSFRSGYHSAGGLLLSGMTFIARIGRCRMPSRAAGQFADLSELAAPIRWWSPFVTSTAGVGRLRPNPSLGPSTLGWSTLGNMFGRQHHGAWLAKDRSCPG